MLEFIFVAMLIVLILAGMATYLFLDVMFDIFEEEEDEYEEGRFR